MSEVDRLYRYFHPSHYKLELSPNKTSMTFEGSVSVTGSLAKIQNTLRLHAKDLCISKVVVNGLNCKFKTDAKNDELIINLPPKVGLDLIVDIKFSGDITKPMHGLYPCFGPNGAIILATQFESHYAREVFPCIDEPEAKAVFGLSLITPEKEVVLANTLPISSTKNSKYITTVFEDTPKMSTYLLAFVIGKLEKQTKKTSSGILVSVWSTPDQVKNTSFALDVAMRALEFFNNYFGIPYPLKKCDLVAIPDFSSGAMENWGLVTFRESCLLVDAKNSSLDTKQSVGLTIVHELVHQWFGNLVTMQWWNDLWLNEGFASWIEFLAMDKLFPDWQMWTQFISTEQQTALRLDSLDNTHPVEMVITNPADIRNSFDNISYAKGACVIHMLNDYLGRGSFRRGLMHYLSKYAYSTAKTADLWESLKETSHKPVAAFMSAWTSQPGFPVVIAKPRDGKLNLSQSRFTIDSKAQKTDTLWPIPLQSGALNKKIMKSKSIDVNMPKNIDSFRLNEGRSAYFISRYWTQQYKRLGEQIAAGKMPETDRIGLLSDMLALTKASQLPLAQLTDILKYYSSETSAAVWDIMATVFGDINRVMGPDVREAIKPLMCDISAAQVARLGWDESKSESHFDKLLRPTVLAMAAGGDNKKVIAEAFKRFNKVKVASDITSSVRGVVLSTVARHGSKKEFNLMLNMLREASSPEDKNILGLALTNFRQANEYTKAISLINSKDVRAQDITLWIIGSLANPAARNDAWQWLQYNWQFLKQNIGDDLGFANIPLYVATFHSQKSFLKQYNAFFNKVFEPGLEKYIKLGQETVNNQAAWRSRDEKRLLTWLKNRG